MRIKHHLGANDKDGSLIEFLNAKKIKYQYVELVKTVGFDVYEDQEVWASIEPLRSKYAMVDLESCEFSKKEIASAERLYLWSKWYWDYPKPDMDGGYKDVTYDGSQWCPQCGVKKIQKSRFRVKGEPSWGTRSVLRLHWVYDELFAKPEVVDTMSKTGITGIQSEPVAHHEKDTELKTLKQLRMGTILEKGLVVKPSVSTQKCTKCGETKFQRSMREMTAFDNKIFRNAPDFARSCEYFGDGASADRLVIVSHKVVELFEKAKWKDVVFEPLELV